jgi:uncharacterized membrane protein YczE
VIARSYPARLVQTALGLVICGIGVTMTLQPALGVSPWDVLHVGLADLTDLPVGTAIIITSCIVLLIGLMLGVRPGVGTIFDVVIMGSTVNLLIAWGLAAESSEWIYPLRIALFLAGTFITGIGIAIYVGAHTGAGPRDGLMVALHHRLHWPISRARLVIELIALTGGLLLSGPIGLGTLLWTLAIGPSTGIAFRMLGQTPRPVLRD